MNFHFRHFVIGAVAAAFPGLRSLGGWFSELARPLKQRNPRPNDDCSLQCRVFTLWSLCSCDMMYIVILIMYNSWWTLIDPYICAYADASSGIPSTCLHQYQSVILNALTFFLYIYICIYIYKVFNYFSFLGFSTILVISSSAFLSPRRQELRELSMDSWVMGWPVVKLIEIYESRHLSELLKFDEGCESAWSVLQFA